VTPDELKAEKRRIAGNATNHLLAIVERQHGLAMLREMARQVQGLASSLGRLAELTELEQAEAPVAEEQRRSA